MTTKSKSLLAIGSIAVFGAVASITMYVNHPSTPVAAPVKAQALSDSDLTTALRSAGLPVRNLVVRTVGDITVLRGEAPDADTISKAADVLRNAGVQRVANMIRVPAAPDDNAIRREAERQLAGSRALDGCTFTVVCRRGVLTVNGKVQSDLQVDAARHILNGVPGVERIEVALAR